MGLHKRAAELYGDCSLVLSTEDYPDISGVEAAFNKAVKWLHGKRVFGAAMLRDDTITGLIEETASFLSKGIERGLEGCSPSEEMVSSLHESVGVFSGFKTFHEMKEAAGMLLDESGNIKPFEQYYKDVQTLNDTYNKFYLKAEYDFTVSSSEMAARWEEQQDDGDGRYLLQYRTVGDNKVRKAHRELEGITLPASDPFWDSYYPPNGWRCRCTVAKVRAAKYPATDSQVAMTAGEKATEGKHAEMFRFNPGKKRAVYPAYNTYTISKCSVCKKGNIELGKVPSNELCAACPIIRECAGDIAKSQTAIERKHYLREMEPLLKKKVKLMIAGAEKSIGFTKSGNLHLYSDTFGRSTLRKEDLSGLDKTLQTAVYVSSASLSHERKDNIKRFHYFKAKINGQHVFLNVAETDYVTKRGKVIHDRFLYSVTNSVK